MYQTPIQQPKAIRDLSMTTYALLHTDLLKSTRQLHKLGLQMLRSVTKHAVQMETMAKSALPDVSYQLAVTEPILSGINFDILGTLPNTLHSMSKFTVPHYRLTESFGNISKVVAIPSCVLPGTTSELYATRQPYPLKDQTEQEEEDAGSDLVDERNFENPSFIALLERTGPECVTMYRGAKAALYGNNPDRSRHVLTSLRELCNHLFCKLVPKEEARKWIAEHDDHGYLRNGEPTRRAEIHYVLKESHDEPLAKLMEASSKVFLELHKLYNRLHKRDPGLTDRQLHAVFIKTESDLGYCLRVRELGKLGICR